MKLIFDRTADNPARIFRSLSEIINAFQYVDRALIKSIDPGIEPTLLLEDVEAGSILVWLKHILRSIDDEALKELSVRKLIGSYLVKAKYAIIDFTHKRTQITNAQEIADLKEELLELARETQTNQLDIYKPVNIIDLIRSVEKIQTSLSELSSQDQIYYLTEGSELPFNLSFDVSPDSIESLLVGEILTSTATMILKIRKPDYLGESEWEFRHGKTLIPAKILDREWLSSYRKRQFDLGPGDALKCNVEIRVRYDINGEVIDTQYAVQRILEILSLSAYGQISF